MFGLLKGRISLDELREFVVDNLKTQLRKDEAMMKSIAALTESNLLLSQRVAELERTVSLRMPRWLDDGYPAIQEAIAEASPHITGLGFRPR